MLVRENPYRHMPPPGWNRIVDAPRDGTVIEIQNNYGLAPTYSVCKWVKGRGWQNAADESSGVGDGPHLSWRPYDGYPSAYVDPTGGMQETMEYWDHAVMRATGGRLNPAVERARNVRRREYPPKDDDALIGLTVGLVGVAIIVFLIFVTMP